ncbi:MAG: hypothetical protein AAGH17_09900 [Pseudomonadota bacterium]
MGRYSYVTQARPPVAFNAVLSDEDGALSGETIEPNTFKGMNIDSLIAGIIGVREGTMVKWSKNYSDFDGSRIEYEGLINPNFTRVEGRWAFANAPWDHGTFVLMRDTIAVSREIRRSKRANAMLPAIWEKPNGTPDD